MLQQCVEACGLSIYEYCQLVRFKDRNNTYYHIPMKEPKDIENAIKYLEQQELDFQDFRAVRDVMLPHKWSISCR